MSLLFVDGFDSSDLLAKWSYAIGGVSVTASTRYSAGLAVTYVPNQSAQVLFRKSIPASAKVVVGFAYKYANQADAVPILTLNGDANTIQHIQLRVLSTGAVSIARGATLIATSAPGLVSIGTWSYYEISATVASAGGVCDVRVNGALVISFTGNTKNAGTANAIDGVNFFFSATTCVPTFDDIYILDGLGSVNNNFLGEVRIQTLRPDGAGSTTNLTPVGSASNWQNVDEAVADAVDYNQSSTSGHKDLYALEGIVAGTTSVKGVQVTARTSKSGTATISSRALVRANGTTEPGPTAAASTTLGAVTSAHDLNPGTGVAWAVADIAAMEAGVEVI